MLYQPDLIVYLWLLPVFILVIIPVLFKTGCSLYRITSRGQVACAKEYSSQTTVQSAERRKSPRVYVTGAVARIAGTGELSTAMVSNVSKFGICLKNLTQALLNETEKIKVIVSTQAGNFELLVCPRWEKLLESGYLVGAEIEDVPQGWNEYVLGVNQTTDS